MLPVVICCVVIAILLVYIAAVVEDEHTPSESKFIVISWRQVGSSTSVYSADGKQVKSDILIDVGIAHVNKLKSSHSTVKLSNWVVLFPVLETVFTKIKIKWIFYDRIFNLP